MAILLLDNYDSFTWNLYHLLVPHAPVEVCRNDAITVAEAARFERIVLSPGPGLPSEAGVMMDLLRELMPVRPILGVCLGMQAIVEACGGALVQRSEVMHGRSVSVVREGEPDALFHGVEEPFTVGLYHSWAADPAALPGDLRITARSDRGVIMALRHRRHATCGVQFHPESILTPDGARMIDNWIEDTASPVRTLQ